MNPGLFCEVFEMFLSTASIHPPGIKDKEKLVEQLLKEPGVKNVWIVANRVHVTYNPSEISAWFVYNTVKGNRVFTSKG